MTKTIVFLGAKPLGYACLTFLWQNAVALDARVVAVGTNDKAVLNNKAQSISSFCEIHQIPILSNLADLPTCDFIISVQYHQILRQNHIDQARCLAINLHTAPLPEYRGCHPFSFAIADGATEYGTTLHRLEAGIDSGDILFEKRFPIPADCWVKDLFEQTQQHSIELFRTHIGDILAGSYAPIPQNTRAQTHSSNYHFRKDIEQLKAIDLSWSAEKIERHLRATYFPPFAPPYFIVAGKRLGVAALEDF